MSLARFVSVSALLMLGVFVLIGLNVTGPNMRQTAQTRYNSENLADAKISSTIDLNAKDRQVIRDLNGIKTVEFGHTTDAVISGSTHAMRIQSNPDKLSKLTMQSGHRAKKANQIVLSEKLKGRYHLGDWIKLASGKRNSNIALKNQSFKVAGFATSSEFLKKDKIGSSPLGNGTLYGFGYVTRAAFSSQQPNFARLAFSHARGKAYSASYENHARKLIDEMQPQLNARNQARVSNLRETSNDRISSAQVHLNHGQKSLTMAKNQLSSASQQLDTQLQAAKSAHNYAAVSQLQAQKQQLDKQRDQLQSKQTDITRVRQQINNAKQTKAQLKNITLVVQSRNDFNDGYNQYGEDAARIDALGKSFPLFFFLIAILVSFTTMQRMVDEKRIEIGTLRALGYTNVEVMREFLLYSFTTAITGTILGSLLGLIALPQIIFRAYTANFNFTHIHLFLHPWFILLSFAIALASTVLASWLAIHSSLKIIPAELMLPKPPAKGSRIFLERIKPLWNRLSFSHKVTARNLFRYKGRMMMTIIGVAGATALMITGFGIRDSLNTIVDRQFGSISKYDLVTVYNPGASDQAVKDAKTSVSQDAQVKRDMSLYYASTYATRHGDARENVALMVPKHSSELQQSMKLNDYRTGHKLHLSDRGAIVSQKLAKLQNVKVGGTFKLHDADGTAHTVKVAAIATMYAGHDVYMNQSYYHHVYGETADDNAFMVTLKHATNANVNHFASRFNREAAAVSTVQSQETKETITNILSNLNNLILVLVLSASLLSLAVLYTLTNINVSERVRELATLKVLGFYPKEVLMYIYRETDILTGAGILVGIGVGYAFHAYIMGLLPPSTAMVAPGLTWLNVIISVALTIIFSLIVMVMMNRKIQQVDMLGALKSID